MNTKVSSFGLYATKRRANNMLTKTQKLIAVETYLGWTTDTEEDKQAVLEHIWWVVMEGRFKPEESTDEPL